MVELDVLRDREGRLVIAHDYDDALTRRPLDLTEALDAFLRGAAGPGRDRLRPEAARPRGRARRRARRPRAGRAGDGLDDGDREPRKLRKLEPDLRLGWTYPEDPPRLDPATAGRAPGVAAGLAAMRRRFPKIDRRRGPPSSASTRSGPTTRRSPRSWSRPPRTAGVELIAWTVDDAERIAELAEMGVDGIVSNDPRLFAVAEKLVAAEAPEPNAGGRPRGRRAEPRREGAGRRRRSQARQKAAPERAPRQAAS